jgi:hypothetical protein
MMIDEWTEIHKMRNIDKNRKFLVVKIGTETVFVGTYLQTILPN